MKNISILLVLFFLNGKSQVKWNIQNDTAYKWFYLTGDEFSFNTIDDTKWISHFPWSRNVVSSGCFYKDENITFADGYANFKLDRHNNYEKLMDWELKDNYVLKHIDKKKNDTYFFDYSGGLIWSVKPFKYGQFEIRFKSPSGSGIWPAFWLYGGNPNYEIDFFELKGEKNNKFHVDVHCPNGCSNYRNSKVDLSKGWGHWIKTSNYFDKEFNIISGNWDEDGISFYLNGVYMAYYKGKFDSFMNLTTGIGIAQKDGPFHPGEDAKTIFPSSLTVDYIRVWANKDTVYDVQNNYKLFEFSNATTTNQKLLTEAKVIKGKNSKKNPFINQIADITLLPITYNKFSLSIAGKKLNDIQVDVFDNKNIKVAGFKLNNVEYYILDLSNLPTGPYDIKINVLGQTLTHNVPVIDPLNNGIERKN